MTAFIASQLRIALSTLGCNPALGGSTIATMFVSLSFSNAFNLLGNTASAFAVYDIVSTTYDTLITSGAINL